MNRRDLVRLGWATVIGAGAGRLRPAFAEPLGHAPRTAAESDGEAVGTEGQRGRGGFHPANRTHDGRAGPAGCHQHDRVQQ